ncbi:MAG: hypothetical protein IJN03_01125 [Bacilli bacterium]|nr:hypothetical protein [Bacilli bacterium]
MKKLIILIAVIIIFFVFFLFMYFSPRNYEKKYEINKVEITEKYNKEKQYYYFNLKYEDKELEYAYKSKYLTKRGLIKDVEILEEKDTTCLEFESKYLEPYPLCYKDNKQVSYNLTDINFDSFIKKYKEEDKSYKDININYLNDKTILTWNYKGFNVLKKDNYQEINFLKKDNYNLELVAKVNNYLIIPDYDQEHSFNNMYLLNLKSMKLEKWDLKYEIYFDSYVVGVDGKSIFIFDNKDEILYELRPDKKKMRKIKYKGIVNDKWQELSLGDFNKKKTFTRKNVYNYEVINNELYLKYLDGNNKILLSDKTVKEIVAVENTTVYYLVDDKLYMYNYNYGEIKLLEYFEWNFNYKNMIYIY